MSGVERLLAKLERVRQVGPRRWMAACPAHEDASPSLSVGEADDDKPLWHCHAGCAQEAVLAAVELTYVDLLGDGGSPSRPRLSIAQLAFAKNLPEAFLRELGCTDGRDGVRIPYADASGTTVAVHTRMAMRGNRFRWRTGDKTLLYGLERLREIRAAGWVLVVEGDSDCWTAWYLGLPALGIPGKGTWREEWATYLSGLPVYLWQEPEAEDLVARVAADLPDVMVIVAPQGTKDISEAHVRGEDVATLLEGLKATSRAASDLGQERRSATAATARDAAAAVLAHPDPLALVEAELTAQGYGGDTRAPLLGYLAMTSRVLAMRPGSMPAHTLFKGPSSGGKNHALRAGLNLLPPEAYHVIDAGSARVLIYDPEPVRHRVVVFGAADSLPAGEDNPAASAIRNLLQDGRLHYQVTVPDPVTGGFTVMSIDKPGPSVLMTTSTRSLGPQLMTRLFDLEVPDEPTQLRAALAAQARLEAGDVGGSNPGLIAFQAYLQAKAPIDVVVPFASELALLLGRWISGPRVLRDYQRLLSLIKAAALMNIGQRERDGRGRLVATPADYAAVHRLLADTYEASAGASQRVRAAIEAVAELMNQSPSAPVSVSEVAEKLGIPVPSAWRRVGDAIRHGWLLNDETRKGQRAKLRIGEPLPAGAGLPSPDELQAAIAGRTPPVPFAPDVPEPSVFTFSPDTGREVPPRAGPDTKDDGGSPPVNRENVKTPVDEALGAADPDDGWTDIPNDVAGMPTDQRPSLWEQP